MTLSYLPPPTPYPYQLKEKQEVAEVLGNGKFIYVLDGHGQVEEYAFQYSQSIEHLTVTLRGFAAVAFRQILCGENFVVGLDREAQLWSRGENEHGQLGVGDKVAREAFQLVKFFQPTVRVQQFACGAHHVLALDQEDGKPYAWGLGSSIGYSQDLEVPGWIQFESVRAVHCGEQHSFILQADGTLQVVGQNKNGQLGNGTLVEARKWVTNKLARLQQLFPGPNHTIAADLAGRLGQGTYGQLGTGQFTEAQVTPVPVVGLPALPTSQPFTLSLFRDVSVFAADLPYQYL